MMMLKSEPSIITYADFLRTVELLSHMPQPRYYEVAPYWMRRIDWLIERPLLRRLYREAGYPMGRNQGAFKRWALLRGRYDNAKE